MKNIFSLRFFFYVNLLCLSGCTYQSQFDCPVGKRLACSSLSKVNRLVDEGKIIVQEDLVPDQKKHKNNRLSQRTGPRIEEKSQFHKRVRIYYPPVIQEVS